MAVKIGRIGCIALLLGAALVLHLFMLTSGPDRPSGHETAHGGNAVAAMSEHLTTAGHDGLPAAHSSHDMLSTCFAVLALVTAGLAQIRARLPRTDHKLDDDVARPNPRVNYATCRDGPSGSSRVDAGVLLRV